MDDPFYHLWLMVVTASPTARDERPRTPGLVERAEEAVRAADDDPRAARRAAQSLLAEAVPRHAWEAVAVAERALVRAACELGEVPDAIVHVRRALAAAARCGVADRVVEIQTTAANVWLLQGAHAKAFAALAAAEEAAGGVPHPRTVAQRAVVLWQTGQLDAAIGLSQALVRRTDLDAKLRADTLVNLGCMWGEQGRFAPAGAALAEAVELFDQLGLALAAADATYNLSHLRTLEGHLPEALRLLDDVEERLVAAGASTLWVVLGRTHLLLQANLVEEAVQVCEAVAADRTVPLHVRAEATWRLALALLRAGDLGRATKEASAAARLFQRVGDAPRAAIATRVEVQARAAAGRATARLLDRASAGREVLAASGLASDALDAQVDVIQLAAALGRSGRVADELVAIRLARRRGPVAGAGPGLVRRGPRPSRPRRPGSGRAGPAARPAPARRPSGDVRVHRAASPGLGPRCRDGRPRPAPGPGAGPAGHGAAVGGAMAGRRRVAAARRVRRAGHGAGRAPSGPRRAGGRGQLGR